ncbi:hypothetical protein [Kitasatospora sp. NPDC004531]
MLTTRSPKESHLYMTLRPCDCGAATPACEQSVRRQPGALVAVHEGRCPSCGRPRRFEFRLPETAAPDGKFGGADASTLLDAGEFLAVSEHYRDLARTRARQNTPEALAAVVPLLDEAIAAFEEIDKFIPRGADDVPADTVTSEIGRKVYAANAGRFNRRHLDEALHGLHRLRAAYAELGA